MSAYRTPLAATRKEFGADRTLLAGSSLATLLLAGVASGFVFMMLEGGLSLPALGSLGVVSACLIPLASRLVKYSTSRVSLDRSGIEFEGVHLPWNEVARVRRGESLVLEDRDGQRRLVLPSWIGRRHQLLAEIRARTARPARPSAPTRLRVAKAEADEVRVPSSEGEPAPALSSEN